MLSIALASASDLRSWLFGTACSLSFRSLFNPFFPFCPRLGWFWSLAPMLLSQFLGQNPPISKALSMSKALCF